MVDAASTVQTLRSEGLFIAVCLWLQLFSDCCSHYYTMLQVPST